MRIFSVGLVVFLFALPPVTGQEGSLSEESVKTDCSLLDSDTAASLLEQTDYLLADPTLLTVHGYETRIKYVSTPTGKYCSTK